MMVRQAACPLHLSRPREEEPMYQHLGKAEGHAYLCHLGRSVKLSSTKTRLSLEHSTSEQTAWGSLNLEVAGTPARALQD
jgi:hypothetical protein